MLWLLVAATGSSQPFFGHVENYSLLTAGTMWTLVLCIEAAVEVKNKLLLVAPVGLALAGWVCLNAGATL